MLGIHRIHSDATLPAYQGHKRRSPYSNTKLQHSSLCPGRPTFSWHWKWSWKSFRRSFFLLLATSRRKASTRVFKCLESVSRTLYYTLLDLLWSRYQMCVYKNSLTSNSVRVLGSSIAVATLSPWSTTCINIVHIVKIILAMLKIALIVGGGEKNRKWSRNKEKMEISIWRSAVLWIDSAVDRQCCGPTMLENLHWRSCGILIGGSARVAYRLWYIPMEWLAEEERQKTMGSNRRMHDWGSMKRTLPPNRRISTLQCSGTGALCTTHGILPTLCGLCEWLCGVYPLRVYPLCIQATVRTVRTVRTTHRVESTLCEHP